MGTGFLVLLLASVSQGQARSSANDDVSFANSSVVLNGNNLIDKLVHRADHPWPSMWLPQHGFADDTVLGKASHVATFTGTIPAIPCPRYGCHNIADIPSKSTAYARSATPYPIAPHMRSTAQSSALQRRCEVSTAARICDDILEPIEGLHGAQIKIKRCEAANLATTGSTIELLFHVEGVRGNLPVFDDKETCMQLHWGVISQSGSWEVPQSPPPNALPTSDGLAMRTKLSVDDRAVLKFPCDLAPSKIGVVLLVKSKGSSQWLKAHGGADFIINVADALKLWQWQSNVPRAAPALPKVGGSQTSHLCSIEKAAPGEVTKLADLDEFMIAQQCDPDRIMVIMYYAAWCQTCKVTKHHVMRFAKQIPEVRFFEMDYGSNKDLCQSLGITKLPFMEMYAHGQGKLDSFVCMPRHLERLKLRLDYERKRMSGDVPKVIPR
eukprot:gnl/TRDRNA2_/TRDRNA2_166874_c0_seq2.p1 gnl/TRDRNA2_/TRDRNA2_166874_c0~~gnl/TRDRNA2_/TRDRNA2_166874_c0_seq2.p1  ORF type:complete len:438 (-),score=56.88 gnl/TRDRNA2_/TRDRNA2_166874_c0_seq2:607-1920(-)